MRVERSAVRGQKSEVRQMPPGARRLRQTCHGLGRGPGGVVSAGVISRSQWRGLGQRIEDGGLRMA